jgi:hypothetical protein
MVWMISIITLREERLRKVGDVEVNGGLACSGRAESLSELLASNQ